MKLTNPTEDQINAAFAEHVALIPKDVWDMHMAQDFMDRQRWLGGANKYNFTRSMDAVLPYLEKWGRFEIGFGIDRKNPAYRVYSPRTPGEGVAKSLPLACCIALLRAHGVEVEFTS